MEKYLFYGNGLIHDYRNSINCGFVLRFINAALAIDPIAFIGNTNGSIIFDYKNRLEVNISSDCIRGYQVRIWMNIDT